MGAWKISLFGENLLTTADGKIFPAKHSESLRLVKRLALAGPEGVQSEVLYRHLYSENWDDPQNGLRTQLARLNKRAKALGGPPLAGRTGDRVAFSPGSVICDLWEFRAAVYETQTGGPEAERKAFSYLEHFSLERFASAHGATADPDYSPEVASQLLECLSTLSVLPTAVQHRLKLLQAASIVRQCLPLNSLHTETLLKLYAATQCRQEVLQTFLDYENFLLEELGEQPSARIRDLCESLLVHLDEPTSKSVFNVPAAPKETVGREDLIQTAVQTILQGGRIYVGGVSGVGKTHLMQSVASHPSLNLFKIAWINLAEESPDDVGKLLPTFLPDIVVFDGYSARFASTLRFVQSLRTCHAVVVVGCAPIGFEYDECITVEPLSAGSRANPGPATLLLEKLVGEPITNRYRDAAVSLSTFSHGLPLSLKLIAGLTKTFGLLAVEAQFSAEHSPSKSASQFLQSALLETLAQFDQKSSTAIAAIAGFRERIPISLVNEILGLDIWAIKQLADSGLIEIIKDSLEVRITDTVADLLEDQGTWTANNPAQIEFENALTFRCLRLGVQPPRDESLTSHLRTYFHALRGTTGRKEFLTAIQLLTALRPHPGVFTSLQVDVDDFEDVLWRTNSDASQFIDNALAIGSLHFYVSEADDFEKFLLRVMEDQRFTLAPRESQCEVYSQLGLALRRRSQLAESERMYETGLSMLDSNCKPGLQLKLHYNKSITHSAQHRFADALTEIRAAIKLAEFAPNDNARVELLHMEALCMREAGESEDDVKAALQVSLALARMYKLVPQQGWILQNAVKFLPSLIGEIEAVVISAVGIGLNIEEGLSSEVRSQVKGTCELLYECLKSLGHQSLALEAKLLKERLGNSPLYSAGLNIHRRKGPAEFSLPFPIDDSVVHTQELQSLVLACLRTFGKTPEAHAAIKEWGIDVARWLGPLPSFAAVDLGSERIVNR